MEDRYKEVCFGQYCESCRHRDKLENEYPCDECLEEPINLYTNKPVRYEEMDRKHMRKDKKK